MLKIKHVIAFSSNLTLLLSERVSHTRKLNNTQTIKGLRTAQYPLTARALASFRKMKLAI